VYPQVKSATGFWKWTSWTLLQGLPTVSFFEDRNENDSRLKLGLEWQVTPVSFSFNSNKYVSRFNFFYINPAKRFSGSAELFFQPEFVPGGFKYADLNKFMFKTGGRVVLPIWQKGEYLSFSLGTGYNYQKTAGGDIKGSVTYEAALYSFFGMLGLKFNYNPNSLSRYNFGLYIKYIFV
jgi:hypothetical protein